MLQYVYGRTIERKMRPDEYLSDDQLKKTIAIHIKNGEYRLSEHAGKEQVKDGVDLLDVLHVLKNGRHEKEKTLFDNKHQNWKYAIRGKTEDLIEIRIIIIFSKELIIITVIGL